MTRLGKCVKMLENNEICVVLEVLPDKKKELICMGYFNGNETMFRLTKGRNQTCTIFYEDGHSHSWSWGSDGYTLVSDSTEKKGKLIQSCIEQDFKIPVSRY